MTKDEVIKTMQEVDEECEKHKTCLDCPIWSKNDNECLVTVYASGSDYKTKDNVNQPKHYLKGSMECIDVIRAITSDLNGTDAYYVGNIIKYVWRYNNKNGLEDLRKAKHYLEWLIESLEG